MSDVAHLARAVVFVMGVPVKVGNYLYAQYEYREDKRDRQQTLGWVLRHRQPYRTPAPL
jgi:hypothetical protein